MKLTTALGADQENEQEAGKFWAKIKRIAMHIKALLSQ